MIYQAYKNENRLPQCDWHVLKRANTDKRVFCLRNVSRQIHHRSHSLTPGICADLWRAYLLSVFGTNKTFSQTLSLLKTFYHGEKMLIDLKR